MNDDLISRQDAIAEIYDKYMSSDMVVHNDVANKCMQIIKALPSVTPTERTGHWIECDGYDGDTYYDCSKCGESWSTIEGTPWDNGMNYCPNCGCRMQESEDKE